MSAYPRESIQDAGMELVEVRGVSPDRELLLRDVETKQLELWGESPYFAGYAIQYDGTEFEFITSSCAG